MPPHQSKNTVSICEWLLFGYEGLLQIAGRWQGKQATEEQTNYAFKNWEVTAWDWDKQLRATHKLLCAAVTVTTLAEHQELTAQRRNSSTQKCSKKCKEMLAYSKDGGY